MLPHCPTELSVRFALWDAKDFNGLLQRIETQALQRNTLKRRGKPRGHADTETKSRRAQRMVAEGAYRRALCSLMGKVAEFSPEEEKKWAD